MMAGLRWASTRKEREAGESEVRGRRRMGWNAVKKRRAEFVAEGRRVAWLGGLEAERH